VGGIMGGAWLSGRLAGRVSPRVPAVTIKVLDLAPDRRGMASSLQSFVGAVANGLVAGVVSPLVMHSTVALALTSAGFLAIGLVAWQWVKHRVP
jgi:DHA1 family bicyclomycin/chloramphenicol resistance-like MFS transporter